MVDSDYRLGSMHKVRGTRRQGCWRRTHVRNRGRATETGAAGRDRRTMARLSQRAERL